MADPYLPFGQRFPYEKRPVYPPGDEEFYREDDGFWGESPLDRLYRNGLWYYLPPFAY